MKRTLPLLVVLVFSVLGVASAEDPIDGIALLRICGNAVRVLDGETVEKEEQRDLPYCLGFVTAVRQAIEDEAVRGERFEEDGVQCRWHYETGWVAEIGSVMQEMFRPVCYPKSLTAERIARMTVRFLQTHPEESRLSGAALVSAAIREPFPCAED